MKYAFSSCHPILNFTYFAAVIICSMFFLNPVFLLISFLGSCIYACWLNGWKSMRFTLAYLLPMMLVVALINTLFNHSGVTILFYLRDNPITLESILYGFAAGVMLATVLLWFSCYNAVMTSDKFVYLFGRMIPAMSLIFSMVLRFVPKFKAQVHVISNAQRCIGRDVTKGRFVERARYGMKILSIMTTWSLENAIDTADSMKARGYGLPGRSSFSMFRFDARDRGMLILLSFLIIVVIAGNILTHNTMQYFPSIKIGTVTSYTITVYLAYFFLCFFALIVDLREEQKWKHLKSKI